MNTSQFRSLLFLPASRLDIAEHGADAIILDLEDVVVEADKPLARKMLGALLGGLQQKDVETSAYRYD